MFEQNPTIGPGTGTYASHTFEILLMLLGAFLLGLWLGWLLWAKYKALVEAAQAETANLRATATGLTADLEMSRKRTADSDADNATLRSRIDLLNDENASLIAGIGGLRSQMTSLAHQNEELEEKVDAIAEAVSQPDIPMEIIESPVDVYVESLVDDGEPVEVLDLNPPAQSVEIIEIEFEPEPEIEAEQAATEPEIIVAAIVDTTNEPAQVVEDEPVTTDLPAGLVAEEGLSQQEMPAAEPEKAAEPMVMPTSFVPAATADNLQIVEGIGPKIEQVLFATGIHTWRHLAETPIASLREILHAKGSRYSMHDPSTWPEQARIAEEGDWEKLKAWQDELKGGRGEALAQPAQNVQTEPAQTPENQPSQEPEPVAETPLSNEELADIIDMPAVEIIDLMEVDPTDETVLTDAGMADDLKIVEGIGPKIQDLLQKQGISTFSQLASTPVNRIKEILENAGPSYSMHDPGTWPAQALLAANAEWDNLKAYQGFLNAGKRPS